MEKNFHISQSHFQVILSALSEQPFKIVAPIIQTLQTQAKELDEKQAKEKVAGNGSAGEI